ncbi:unnamed protein product [Lasius platythorax]|uniref:Uncharacterized protein n=1 Tax=Lasius platythorax TaxID=488582 RepID=A0AAV2N3W0_9HYME
MLTSRGSAGGARILPDFSALSARVDRIAESFKPAGNKCKDNEGVGVARARASTAGIRPADKAPVFLAAWIQPRDNAVACPMLTALKCMSRR